MQVTWSREEVKVWDSKARKYLKESDFAGKPMEVKLKIDMFVATRFLAKVALGSGYFIYGDLFKSNAECNALRVLASLDPEKDRKSDILKNSTIRICDRFHADSMDKGPAVLCRALCEGTKRTLLIAVPTQSSVSFHVGIVGMYIGSIDIPADTAAYPLGGNHDVGHAIVLGPGEMERLSLRELAGSFYRSTTGREPPEPN